MSGSSSDEEFDPLDCSTEAWYSQWWMCGFGDAIKDVMFGPESKSRSPKRSTRSTKLAEKTKAKRGEC